MRLVRMSTARNPHDIPVPRAMPDGWRPFSRNPVTGLVVDTRWDPLERKLIFRERQRVGALLEANLAQRNDDDLWHQQVKANKVQRARIPTIILNRWRREFMQGRDPKTFHPREFSEWVVARKYNDPDFGKLLTTTRRL